MKERLTEIDKQMEQLKKEKEEILKTQENEYCRKNWDELSAQAQNCSIENMVSVELEETTKTIPIFESFTRSQKTFLLLKNIGLFVIKSNTEDLKPSFFAPIKKSDIIKHSSFSLILCKSWKKLFVNRTNITPTKLKQAHCLYIETETNNLSKITNISNLDNSDTEFKLLWKELNSIPFIECVKSVQNETQTTQKTFIFSKPLKMGAQIIKNREGYGNIYRGEELISKGTEYGETTPFLIIGCIVHNNRL